MPQGYTDADFQPLQNVEALANFQGKSILSRYHYADVMAREHALAFSVAKMMDEDMLSEVQSAITDALTNGTDFRDFEKRLKPYLMSRGWWGEQVIGDPKDGSIKKVQLGSTRRLRTIYHTNLHSSYAAGQWQRIQETKRALPYLQYMPSLSANPRHEHKSYYNLVRPIDDPIWLRIFPPNGHGCLCWIKQLTRSQARREGISDEVVLETEETTNPRTGEKTQTPKGIDPSFDHNHDRNTAMQRLYAEKLQTWTHVPPAQKANHLQRYEQSLNNYMLALVRQPDFSDVVPTINSTDFAKRVGVIAEASKAAESAGDFVGIGVASTKESHQWAVATLSASIQGKLDVDKYIAWLGEDTLTTMIKAAKNSADDVVALLRTTKDMLSNADELIKLDNGGYQALFISNGKRYQATLAVDKALDTLNIIDLVQL